MSARKRIPVSESGALRTNLAGALAGRGLIVSPAAPSPPAAPAAPPADADLAGCGKIVLRHERKGRGGKTATVVAGLALHAPALDNLARELRHALGCGATVEGDMIVVQGDLAARIEPWLRARGARKIVVGS